MDTPPAHETPAATQQEPQAPRNQRQARGDHGHSRRGGPSGERGRGGLRRGRGSDMRGSAPDGRNNRQQLATPQTTTTPVSGLQDPASETNGHNATNGTLTSGAEDDVEVEVCFICASPVVHNSVQPCNHRTCHICALRMRALYKNKACMHCRTNAESVVFTDDPTKRFEDFTTEDFIRSDDNLGIKYENQEIFEDTVLLLRYNCPDEGCDIACYGWPDLHRHVKNVHHKVMCDLCTRNKKVFTHEHTLFTHNDLRKHEKFGDDNPGAVDQSGFKGHPECGFCRERFYGDDELYTHCREKHERCHICDRRSSGRQQQYFKDYNALEVHFQKDHFVCLDQECLDKKFVVFETEMDLKAHQLESHPNGLSKDARRDARRVDMSGFDYRQPHQEPRGGGARREGRGRGRGRDPNTDAIPVSSAQPMRRDELAFQRQMAIHSAQSISNRTFGGQLTANELPTARTPAHTADPQTIIAPREGSGRPRETLPQSEPTDAATHVPSSNVPLTPAERARQLRHATVTERASNLLQHSAPKLETFRSKVSLYRNNNISAPALIDAFFALFDTSAAELGTLIKELAEIFEIPGKRDDLLKAWNDWRAINEDYPSLPGPNGLPAGGGANAGSGGKRILKLKSSTTRSSQSAVSRQGSWGTANGNAGGNSSRTPFPAMPSASANRAGAGKVSATPWVTPASSVSIQPRATPAPSRPTSARPPVARPGADAFPSLPMAQKPGMNISRPGYAGNPVIKGKSGSSTPSNPWANAGGAGVGNLTAALNAATLVDDEDTDESQGKRKGKKKQTLIHWG